MPLAEVFSTNTIRLNRQPHTFLRDAGVLGHILISRGASDGSKLGLDRSTYKLQEEMSLPGQAHKVRYQEAEASLSEHVSQGESA
jgi:hypothetical protein